MIFKMLSDEHTEMLSLLRKKGRGRHWLWQGLILPSPEGEGGPTIHRAKGRNWFNGSLFPPGAVTSGKESPLPKSCQPFSHLNTLTCTNRECLSSKPSFKDGLDLGREGAAYSAGRVNYFDLMLCHPPSCQVSDSKLSHRSSHTVFKNKTWDGTEGYTLTFHNSTVMSLNVTHESQVIN